VKNAQWGEALAAFERASVLQPHALTTFNMGACERALGRYTRARATLLKALAQNADHGSTELAPSLATDAKGWISEIDAVLVHADVTVDPPGTSMAVDGRPLAKDPSQTNQLVAGIEAPGRGSELKEMHFALLLDPGAHVFTLQRKGFTDAVVNRTFSPGAHPSLTLQLDKLPASIRVQADRAKAVVALDGSDVGTAPIDLSRPAGAYHISVTLPGFEPYKANVAVAPGEEADLRAVMVPEKVPITAKWWFWTAAAVVVAGVGVTTYVVTRPAPQRPAPDGGGLGWVLVVP
jgi:hypothetical protein